jgi:hypothetical protein
MTHQACELIRLTASLDWKQVELCSPPDIRVILQSVAKAFPLEDWRGALLEVPNGIE